jgi:hypothetical protein
MGTFPVSKVDSNSPLSTPPSISLLHPFLPLCPSFLARVIATVKAMVDELLKLLHKVQLFEGDEFLQGK